MMIASNPQHHEVHRLVPRRKIKAGFVMDIPNKSSGATSAAVEISANRIMDGSSLNTTAGNKTDYEGVAASISHTSRGTTLHHLQVTPDKSKPPSSDSSSDESEDERAKLIAEIDVSKLSPGIDLRSMGNYELLRLRNIQRNEAKLASLGLVGLTSKDKKPKPKPVKKTPKKRAAPVKNSQYVFNQYQSSQKINWHTRYDELCGFHKQHGHLTVPKAMKTLSGWTQRQKAQYKNYKLGTKHNLDEEKLRLLKELGVDELWCGNSTKKKAATRKRVYVDEDEIGSLDSYSECDDSSDESNGRKISKQELDGLKSPKWMNDRSNAEYEPYFSSRKMNSAAKDAKRIGKRLSVYKQNKFDTLNDGKPKHCATTSNATKTDIKPKLKAAFSDEDTESEADRHNSIKMQALQQHSDDESCEQYKEHNYNRRNRRKKCHEKVVRSEDDGRSRRLRYCTDKRAKRHKLRNYSDDESVKYDGRRINSLRSSKKREVPRLRRRYSDEELSSAGKNGLQSSPMDQKKQITTPKARCVLKKSSLEMIDPNGEVNTQHSNHRPSKRRGVVSEESERPIKRLCQGHTTESYSQNSYSSETTGRDESEEMSYSDTSDSSTRSSSLYDPNKPVNEVVITKATQSLTTRNTPINELAALMSERSKLMLEYEYLYSNNVEKMKRMPQLICDMYDIEQILIKSGSTLCNRVEGTEHWLKRAEAQRAMMLEGSLVRPEILMLRTHTARLMEGPISRSPKVLPNARYAGLIKGASLR